MDPIRIPIEDVLDLHTFRPAEISDLLEDGKASGVQKKRVQTLLKKHPLVKSFRDAPAEAGGWGATLVELNKDSRQSTSF
jgi:hypothetical protein